MNPFSSRCCQHNHAQGWPYYTEHLVMATPDNGLVAALYGACQVKAKVGNGKEIVLKETTHYPFEETIAFTVDNERKCEFPVLSADSLLDQEGTGKSEWQTDESLSCCRRVFPYRTDLEKRRPGRTGITDAPDYAYLAGK